MVYGEVSIKMIKHKFIFFFSFLFVLISISFISSFSGAGDGSINNPFRIANCTQLQEINDSLDSNYILNNNIDCADSVNWDSGFSPIPNFTGNFNGVNYIISNLFINRTTDNVGLFSVNLGNITNVNLINLNVSGLDNVGGLVGNNSGNIINCYVNALNVSGVTNVGGLVGLNMQTITYSHSSGNVQSQAHTGGLVGQNEVNISKCYSNASVIGNDRAGGLVGGNGYYIDGLAKIFDSYALGNITATHQCGGFAGDTIPNTIINNSYSVGNVTFSTGCGGFSGWDSHKTGGGGMYNPSNYGTYQDDFYNVNTSKSTSQGGTGKTSIEMIDQSTYVNWDFNNTWGIYINDYPFLILNKLQKLADLPDIYLNFLDYIEFPLNNYFRNWYDLAIIFNDPNTNIQTALITGHSTAYSDYFNIGLGIIGSYDNLTINSFQRNYTAPLSVYACNSSTLDDWCPVLGFPDSCNISRFFTDETCLGTSFYLNINDSYTPAVTRNNLFLLYYLIPSNSYQFFSISNYYNDYRSVEISYYDSVLNRVGNTTLSCDLGDSTNTTNMGNIRVNLDCRSYTAYLYIFSDNYNDNVTFYINASNSNNSLMDYFIANLGNYTYDLDNRPIANWSSFKGIFPETTNYNKHLLSLIIIISALVILISGVGFPLHFSAFSLWIVGIGTWFVDLFMAITGYGAWSWVIIPPVVLIIFFIMKGWLNG